jgi:hypothetical protein
VYNENARAAGGCLDVASNVDDAGATRARSYCRVALPLIRLAFLYRIREHIRCLLSLNRHCGRTLGATAEPVKNISFAWPARLDEGRCHYALLCSGVIGILNKNENK